ncbi:MAG TPA: pyridoxamine 5'-phosphate oxidase family protein [Burkholderiaceae bacterium]
MDHDKDAADRQARLFALIKDVKFAMFTTHTASGHLHSRPMTTLNTRIDEDDALWFFMSRAGAPVAEMGNDTQVNVSYANPSDDAYVSVTGVARVVEDLARKQALWTPAAQAWFSGVDDPDLALVEVHIEHADYWNVRDNKLVQLYKRAEAALSGKQPNLAEHGRVRPH